MVWPRSLSPACLIFTSASPQREQRPFWENTTQNQLNKSNPFKIFNIPHHPRIGPDLPFHSPPDLGLPHDVRCQGSSEGVVLADVARC